MTIGKSNLEILSVSDYNLNKKQKKSALKNPLGFLYNVKVTNLTANDLELLYYFVEFINSKRSDYDKEETTS